MEYAKQAYDAFNRLWAKVPRHVRVDRDNHQLMLSLRSFFDGHIEVERRRMTAAEGAGEPASSSEPEDDDAQTDPVRLALRLLRTLTRREWEMVKTIADLHKFGSEDFLDLLNVIRDVHCSSCGEWLDDDDEHVDCPAPSEDDDDAHEDTPSPTGESTPKGLPSEVALHAVEFASKTELDELDE